MNNDPNYATLTPDGAIRSSGRRPTKRTGPKPPRRPRTCDGSSIPSHRLIRGACYGDMQIDGRDLAENIATGKLNVARRGTDAAGPLRENVGLTVTSLDYRRTRDHGTFEKNPHPAHVAASNAAKIDAYVNRSTDA